MTGDWTKLHKEPHNGQSRRMRWARHVVGVVESRNLYVVVDGKLEEK
jgi:hypothetical protein